MNNELFMPYPANQYGVHCLLNFQNECFIFSENTPTIFWSRMVWWLYISTVVICYDKRIFKVPHTFGTYRNNNRNR